MSFLFPLYALGALAIGLPLLFHLIQRRPRGSQPFSSLMFLSPSPPRMTRRSRLDNLLLLLLRAAALLLLALAFARPFLRSFSDRALDTPARRIVLLVDASASMRRGDLWQQARLAAEQVIGDIQPSDQVALAVFDRQVTTVAGFEDTLEIDAVRRPEALRKALAGTSPGWAATDLGQALVTAADMLQTAAEGRSEEAALPPQIVLVTDLQSGSDLSALDGYEWPAEVQVDVRTVQPRKTTNASCLVLRDSEPPSSEDQTLAVRVHNADDSLNDQFRIGWADSQGRLLDDREYPINVPPGESRVLRVEPAAQPTARLMLIGDDHEFDNTLYIAPRVTRQRRVLYIGRADEPEKGLLYYLRRAPLDTPWQQITVQSLPPGAPLKELDSAPVEAPVGGPPQELEELKESDSAPLEESNGGPLEEPEPLEELGVRTTPLVVLAAHVSPATAARLREDYVKRGGRVLVVLSREVVEDDAMTACLSQLLALPSVRIEPAEVADYAMLQDIDFRHPLFEPFADPRFSDFTKIRFWRHSRLTADEELTWDVLATFDDDGSPALVQQTFGQGSCWILGSGWQPQESQLALSTKFIPLLAGLLDPRGGRPPVAASYLVGDRVALPPSSAPEERVAITVAAPDGEIQSVSGKNFFDRTTEPGVYSLRQGGHDQAFAVNVAPDESRTTPLDVAELEQRGVRSGVAKSMEEIQTERRQMRDTELESRQKVWRWLLAGALGLLLVETGLAGWLSRRRASQ